MTRREFFLSSAAGAGALASPDGLLAQAREKARPLHLKVRDLKTFIVNRGGQNAVNYVFVKIYTDQGITGLGEGSVTSKEATVAAAIEEHKRYLVGRDPADIEMHWQAMYRWPRWRGGPILNSAISAVEIALWDILGQALGQPVWKLLGGKARERVQMYVHAGGRSPEDYAKNWLQAKEEGWTGCKAGFITTQGDTIDPVRSVREGIANLRAVRRAVGDDFRICIDLHGKTTPTMAVDFCRRAEEFSPYFVEEATQLEDLDELALLRSRTRIPLATGERLTTKYGFNQICHRHLVDYVQPDVVHCGGILEMKKIAVIAESYRIELAPHNPQSEVSTLASLHVDFSTPNFGIQEISHRGNEQYWKDLFYGGGITYEKGYAQPPDRPGLGVNLDEKVAALRPYQPHTRGSSCDSPTAESRTTNDSMTRRQMLYAAGASLATPLRAAARPNVLLLIADDLNTDLACYGTPQVKTPHIDRLAARGVRFDRAYCQYPLCNPSRTSFLSGLSPEKSRVLEQRQVLRTQNAKVEFLPDFFKRNGYFVGGAGKVFHQGKPNAVGFDEWAPAEGEHEGEAAAIKRRYANPEGNRTPDWAVLDDAEEKTADAAVVRAVNGWMERCALEGKPFFVTAGFRKPHLPWAVPKHYFNLYTKAAEPHEPAMHGIPAVALVTELTPSKPPQSRTEAIAAYRAATSYMDAQVGKILAAMDRLKLWEQTVVVFLGDNGFHLGDHGLWSKHTMFERATRVPLVVAAPGVKGGAASARTAELLDVYPTLAELAGLAAPAGLEGKSLVPLLRKPDAACDRPARSVVQREGVFGRTVRTEQWRYVEWNGGKEGAELYDHTQDDGEYRNLAGDPSHAAAVKAMRALLARPGRAGKFLRPA